MKLVHFWKFQLTYSLSPYITEVSSFSSEKLGSALRLVPQERTPHCILLSIERASIPSRTDNRVSSFVHSFSPQPS